MGVDAQPARVGQEVEQVVAQHGLAARHADSQGADRPHVGEDRAELARRQLAVAVLPPRDGPVGKVADAAAEVAAVRDEERRERGPRERAPNERGERGLRPARGERGDAAEVALPDEAPHDVDVLAPKEHQGPPLPAPGLRPAAPSAAVDPRPAAPSLAVDPRPAEP